jgi:PAS domain S-box-containing protein
MDNTGVEIDRIRDILKSCRKGQTIAEIARTLDLNRISTSKYLNMMVAAGEAEMRVHGPSKVYYPCQRVPISSILNFSSDILAVMDETLTIVDVNNVLLDYFSVKKSELIGHRIDYSPLGQYIDTLILDHIEKAIDSTGSTLKTKQTIKGNDYYFQLKFIPTLFESGDHGVTLIAEDITELSLHRQHLEQLVDERSQELVSANEQLKKEILNYKKARSELKASEIKYRELVENANSIILRMDPRGTIEFFNEFAQDFFGWKLEEIFGKSIYNTIVPKQPTAGKPVKELLEGLKLNPAGLTRFENENIKRNGERAWISWTNKFIRNAEGSITGILSIGNDITDLKQVEDELKLHNVLLSTQNETTIDGILVVDETNTVISYNQRFVELWGIPEERFEKNDDAIVLDYVHHLVTDPVPFRKNVEDINKDHQQIVRDEVFLKDGRWFDRYSAPMIGPDKTYYGRIWYFRDKTDQKHYEDQLRKSEEKLAAIIDFLPDATFVIDAEGYVIAWNRAMEEWTGIPEQDILGQGNFEYAVAIHGFRKPILIDFALNPDQEIPKMYSSCKRESNKFIAETVSTYHNPEGIWIWGTASPLYDATGTVIGAIESIRDITALKRTEQALKEREAICSAIVEDQTEMICRFLPDGTFVFVNEAFAQFFTTLKDKIIGTRFLMPVVEEDRPVLHHYFSGIDKSNPVITIEIRMIPNEDNIRWTRWNIRGLFTPAGKIVEYQAVGRDITDFIMAKESADYQALLLNQVSDAIIATDMDFHITYWNRAAEGLFGWKSREVSGKNIHNLIRFDQKKQEVTSCMDHLMAHGTRKGPLDHVTKSGKHIRVEWSISIFKDHAGTMTGIVGLCREIPVDRSPD